jgi:hypothetical protein
MIPIRSFNQVGVAKFAAWLEAPDVNVPYNLLMDDNLTDVLDAYQIDLSRKFGTTYELGEYLSTQIVVGAESRLSILSNHGMWAWISLAFMGSIKKRQGSDAGKPLAKPHYIFESPRLAYRLVARTSWDLVTLHRAAAKLALGSSKSPWGDMAEQMTSRQEIYAHRRFWQVANSLYTMADGAVKRGATSQRKKDARLDPKNKSGLGGVRRLPFTFRQFERTYNLRQMNVDQIVALLPSEYQKWRIKS